MTDNPLALQALAALRGEVEALNRRLSTLELEAAESRGRQASSWPAIEGLPPRVAKVEARLDAVDRGGIGVDRLIGPEGYFRSYHFLAIMVLLALAVGALQAEQIATLAGYSPAAEKILAPAPRFTPPQQPPTFVP